MRQALQGIHPLRRLVPCFALLSLAVLAVTPSSAGMHGAVRSEGVKLPVRPQLHPFTGGVWASAPGTKIAPGRLLVRYRAGTSLAARDRARRSVGASVAKSYHLVPRLQLLRLPAGRSVLEQAAALQRDPRVAYATPDLERRPTAVPNDPRYGEQWAMPAIGAPAAWNRTTGSASVTVGVIDTGVKFDHEDLTANTWTNQGEIAGNGVDDDGNGYVDDVHGWDFYDNDNDPSDVYGHGTHVAGIVGAAGNNGLGVAGVNWTVRLMPLRICDFYCSTSAEISALQYAVDEGVTVANSSFGGYGQDQAEEDAIAAAGSAGLLDVAAAGNDTNYNDAQPFYPASYPLDNLVSVAATASDGTLASFSNFGPQSVDLGAPGVEILSTMMTSAPLSDPSGYGYLSGTSMAAPTSRGRRRFSGASIPAGR